MKLKRYIAIFMAVLILAVSLPLNSLIMKPSAESASEQDKINAIKTAWALMEEKNLEINPGSGKSNSVTAQYFSSANTSVLPQKQEANRAASASVKCMGAIRFP